MTEIANRYRVLAAEFGRRVDAVPTDGWDSPTPCPGWTARDLLQHVVDSHRDMPAHVDIAVELTESVEKDPAAAWEEARSRMQGLLDDPATASREYDGYFGRSSLQATVDTFLGMDLLIHGWDLARATGGDERLLPAEVTRVYADARSLGDTLRTSGVCGPEVPVPADAPEQDRLLAYLGRDPSR